MSKLLLILFLSTIAQGDNVTTKGRLQVDWPNKSHSSAGADLQNHIHDAVGKLSDNMGSRYEAWASIADATLVTHTHNLGITFSSLGWRLFTGTYPTLTFVCGKVSECATAGWTVSAGGTPTTQIDVTTPVAGGPHNFSLVVTNSGLPSDLQTAYENEDTIVTTATPVTIDGSAATTALVLEAGSVGHVQLNGTTAGQIDLTAPASITDWVLTLPSNDGAASQVLQTDGSGTTTWATVNTDLVGDTTPQLGGDLDLNTFKITEGATPVFHRTGSGSTYLGLNAGTVSITGNFNTVLGESAGSVLTSGNNNTLLGYITGSGLTTETNNVLIGSGTGASLTSSSNVLIGAGAGGSSTTADSAVVVGRQAGELGNAPNSTLLGFQAGRNATGSGNVAIGRLAGDSAGTYGNTVSIGTSSDIGAGVTSNAIAIGFGAIVDANNKIRLGNDSITVAEFSGLQSADSFTLQLSDDTVVDADPGSSLTIHASDKTAGTGNGGNLVLNGGSSVGGTRGDINITSNEMTITQQGAGDAVTITKAASVSGAALRIIGTGAGGSAGLLQVNSYNGTAKAAIIDVTNGSTALEVTQTGGGSTPVVTIDANSNSHDALRLGGTGTSARLRLNGSTSGSMAIAVPAAISPNYTLTMPPDDGDSGEVLTTDGSGVLSWAAAGGGGGTLQSAYDAGNTIAVAASTPVTVSVASTSDAVSIDHNGTTGKGLLINSTSTDNALHVVGSHASSTSPTVLIEHTGASLAPALRVDNDGTNRGAQVSNDNAANTGDVLALNTENASAYHLTLQSPQGNGFSTGTVRVKSPDGTYAIVNLTLPDTDGNPGEVLSTDGSGVLSWSSSPVWTKYTKTFSDFGGGGATETESLVTLPANATVQGVIVKHSVAFSGGTCSALTVEVGISGNTAKYSSAFDVFQAVANTAKQSSNVLDVEIASISLDALFTSTGCTTDIADFTAGSVDIWVLSITLP